MKRKILSNISLNFILRIITYFFSFVELMYVTRVLQPEAFGKISFVSSFVGYFVMFANLGMPIYAMRACAKVRDEKEKLNDTFNELWSLCVILSVVSFTVFFLSVLFVPNLRNDAILLLVYGFAILLQSVNCEWMYKGLENYRFLTVSTLICKVISVCGIFLFVKSSQNILIYAILSVLVAHGSNIVCFIKRKQFIGRKTDFKVNPVHLKPLFVFFMMSFAVSVYNSLDLTMLEFLKTEFDVGIYSVASKGKGVLAMTGGLVWSAILPYATTLWRENAREDFEKLATKSLIIVSGIQFIVSISCIILAPWIIDIIAGENYSGAVLSFRILLLSLLPIAMSNILGGQVLIPAGLEKRLLVGEVAGAIFNFCANLVVIPKYSIEGAAVTTVISEIIVWLFCVFYCKKDLGMDFGMGIIKKIIRKIVKLSRRYIARFIDVIAKDKLPYFCPCCNTYLLAFADGGYTHFHKRFNIERYKGIDQKVICPVCNALPRHRILATWMQVNKSLFENKKILYFAQEKSIKKWCKRNSIECTTADLYQKADLKIDIEDTGLNDNSYDAIFCNHVLEHVSDYKRALKELYRIAKPDGFIILSFPVDLNYDTVYEDSSIETDADRLKYFGQNDHRRVFGRDSEKILAESGFTVTRISGDDQFCDERIKPVIGPADYDYNVLWKLTKNHT